MTRLNWDALPELDRRLVELSHEHEGVDAAEMHRLIAAALTDEYADRVGRPFTEDQVRNRLKRVRFERLGQRPVQVLMPYYERHAAVIHGDEPAPEKVIEREGVRYTLPEYLEYMRAGERKTLVLSDLHIPLQNEAAIQAAIDRNLAAHLVVVNGDIADAYSLSTFAKTEDVPIYSEIDGIVRYFEYMSDTYPEAFVWITEGNHEDRYKKRILPMMPQGLEFLATPHILELLARPFPNIVVSGDWWVQVGDAIYAHADAASGVAGRPAVDVLDWFRNRAEELDLAPFRLVVQAHTHRIAVIYRGQYKAMESGCLCRPMGYARSTRYKNPLQLGYVVVWQRDGRSLLDRCREYPLDAAELERRAA